MSTWRPSRSEDGPRRVRDSLDRVVGRFGGTNSAALTAVFSRWKEIAGDQIAAHARPRSLSDGVLVVVADEPAWAAQLSYLTGDLARRCAEVTGDGSVRRVEVRVDGRGRRQRRPESPG